MDREAFRRLGREGVPAAFAMELGIGIGAVRIQGRPIGMNFGFARQRFASAGPTLGEDKGDFPRAHERLRVMEDHGL